MTAMVWLVIVALSALALLVTAGVIDAVGARRPPARVVQPPRTVPRAYPKPSALAPWHPGFHLARGRHVRAARCRYHLED